MKKRGGGNQRVEDHWSKGGQSLIINACHFTSIMSYISRDIGVTQENNSSSPLCFRTVRTITAAIGVRQFKPHMIWSFEHYDRRL